MSGRVTARLRVDGPDARVEPDWCPEAEAWEARTRSGTPVACWRRSDLFGEHTCRYLLYTASAQDMTKRNENISDVENRIRDLARSSTRISCMCDATEDGALVPGA